MKALVIIAAGIAALCICFGSVDKRTDDILNRTDVRVESIIKGE